MTDIDQSLPEIPAEKILPDAAQPTAPVQWDADALGVPSAPAAPVPPASGKPVSVPPAPVYAVPTRDDRPVRRVGTITSGITLIAGGLLLCAALVMPSMNLLWVFQFAPLLLVFLGIEILVSQLFSRSMRIKYDFLSVLLAGFVLCCGIAASCVPFALRYYGPDRNATQQKLSSMIESELYNELKSNESVTQVNASVYLRDMVAAGEVQTLADLTAQDYIQIRVEISGAFADKAAFLEACRPILEATKMAGVTMSQSVSIRTREQGEPIAYYLEIDSPYLQERDAADLAEMVTEQVYDAVSQTYSLN